MSLVEIEQVCVVHYARSMEKAMSRDASGTCHTCGAGPDEACHCAVSAALALARALSADPAACDECHGDGFCVRCAGDGRVLVRPLAASPTCPDCHGSGYCMVCGGKG